MLAIRSMLEEIGFPQDQFASNGSPLFEDNRGAWCAQRNPINKNLRHINRRIHRIRQEVSAKHIEPHLVRTHHMLADILTKNVESEGIRRHMVGTKCEMREGRHEIMPTKFEGKVKHSFIFSPFLRGVPCPQGSTVKDRAYIPPKGGLV